MNKQQTKIASAKPKVGVLALARSTFDVDYAQEIFNTAWDNLQNLDIELIGDKEIYFDSEPSLSAFKKINQQGIDILLLLQVTFTDAAVCSEIAQILGVPLLVWTFSEERSGGRLRLNSFCGVNLAAHSLSRIDKKLANVHGKADSKLCLQNIYEFAKAANIVAKLKQSKVLVVGEHPVGFSACNYQQKTVNELFGVSIENTPISKFLGEVKTLPDDITKEVYQKRTKDFPNLGEMDQAATTKTLKAFVELKNRADKNGYNAIALRCWPEFFTEYGAAACGAIALLNENKIPGGCEADMYGIISSLILQWSSDKTVFNTDLVDINPEDNTVVFWHCGQAPLDMADPEVQAEATIHTNRKLPLLSQFPLKPGRITICRITQGEGKLRMMLSAGEMIKAPLAYAGTSGVARLDIPADVYREKLLEFGLEHHCSITYGEYRPILRKIANYLNLEVLEIGGNN